MDIDKRLLSFRKYSFLIFPLILLFSFSSCKSRKARSASVGTKLVKLVEPKFDETQVADKIETMLGSIDADDSVWQKNKVFDLQRVMVKAYADEEYFPIWLTQNGDTSYVVKLINDLSQLRYDGLSTDRYKLNDIQSMLHEYSVAKTVSIDDVIKLDTTCTHSYLQASRDLLLGAVVPGDVDTLWHHINDSVWAPYAALAKMGRGETDYLSLDSFRSKVPTYSLLRNVMVRFDSLRSDSGYLAAKQAVQDGSANDSLKDAMLAAELPWSIATDSMPVSHAKLLSTYQYFIGAYNYSKKDSLTKAYMSYPPDSLMRRAAVNMERIRWMQQSLEPMHILVDVPLLELFFRVDGEDSLHMEVVVGKTIRQTPSLYAKMANVVINPPWGVPPTIMKKDVLPGMAKSGKAYLNKKGLKVYDFKGKEVDATRVNSGNYKQYVFRQDPGDDNALGYVKFNLPNIWDIYLHDTPHREDFGKRDRFQSSGCIRVQKPKEMAEFILTYVEGRRYPISRIDSVIATKKTRFEVLKNRIPVHVVYLTAFEDSTHTGIHFLNDIYKRDAKLSGVLFNQ